MRYLSMLFVVIIALYARPVLATEGVKSVSVGPVHLQRIKANLPWSQIFAVHPSGKVAAIVDGADDNCRVELLPVDTPAKIHRILAKFHYPISGIVWSRTGRLLAVCGEQETTLFDFSNDGLTGYKSTPLHCALRKAVFMPDESLLVGVQTENAHTADERQDVTTISIRLPAHPISHVYLPETVYPANEDTPLTACAENAVAISGTQCRILPDGTCRSGWTLGTNMLYCCTTGCLHLNGSDWYLTTVEPTKCVGRGSVFVVQKTLLMAQSADGKQSLYLPWPKGHRIYGLQVLPAGQLFVIVDGPSDSQYEIDEYRILSKR